MLKQICASQRIKQYSVLTLACGQPKLTLKVQQSTVKVGPDIRIGECFQGLQRAVHPLLLPDWVSWASKDWFF